MRFWPFCRKPRCTCPDRSYMGSYVVQDSHKTQTWSSFYCPRCDRYSADRIK